MTATLLEDLGDKALRNLEVGVDGIDLSDRGQQRCFTGADQVAEIDIVAADEPVDGRFDGGVVELDLGVGQLGLGLEERRRRLVAFGAGAGDLLLRDRVGRAPPARVDRDRTRRGRDPPRPPSSPAAARSRCAS